MSAANAERLDYVRRRYELSFIHAMEALKNGALGNAATGPLLSPRIPSRDSTSR